MGTFLDPQARKWGRAFTSVARPSWQSEVEGMTDVRCGWQQWAQEALESLGIAQESSGILFGISNSHKGCSSKSVWSWVHFGARRFCSGVVWQEGRWQEHTLELTVGDSVHVRELRAVGMLYKVVACTA